jgi:hypothetical protein
VPQRLILTLIAAAAATLLAPLAQAQGRPDLVARSLAAKAPYLAGELLVQFCADASRADQARALARIEGRTLTRLMAAAQRRDGRGDLQRVGFRASLDIAAALCALQADAAVDFAEPN